MIGRIILPAEIIPKTAKMKSNERKKEDIRNGKKNE